MRRDTISFALSVVLAAILAALFSFVFLVPIASAAAFENVFFINLVPAFPGPLQDVTAEIVSTQVNTNASSFTWILNGKTSLSGAGKRNFTFKTGEVGSVTSIRVEADTDEFGAITKEIEIRPSDADILWEADTYTPPFYKGKALPSSQSYIKVVGIPQFVTENGAINPDNLVYAWKKTYTPNPDDSGIGKNIYLYRGTYTFNANTIKTVISTPDNKLSVRKETKISISEPKILLYENKPLEGIRYERSLVDNFTLREKEVALRAEPYFFSFANADNNGAVFTWRLDGKRLDANPERKSEFRIGKPATGNGYVNLSLEISNREYSLQSATKNISISY